MFSKVLLTALLVTATLALAAQSTGTFSGFTHVGKPSVKGVVAYDTAVQSYRLEGASGNMWDSNDDFHFLWKRLQGNFIITATIDFIGKGVDPHRKLGLMVRHSLESNSPHVNAVVHGDGLSSMQFRRTPGGITEEVKSSVSGADVLQLERRDSLYIVSLARFGKPFTVIQQTDIPLGDDVYVGIFLCSHNEQAVEKGIFKNVRIVAPAWKGLVPYRDYLGSHLELMDVQSGVRKIVYSENVSLQAPNWTIDGQSLIYNRNGLLYNFDLATRTPKQIDTGMANRNNNDHVLSFDGQMLGISHHSAEDKGVSMVYTLPTTGGVPKKITTIGPSYLHGWSPDGRHLIYTGGRNEEYDIYKISAKGGKETNLTNSPGLDDGSEYSPDGKFIYFNSVRSGNMQIFRMKPDGSHPVQITNDDFNNWFPHISPDGQSMVFLSYMKDVAPGDHPFYKPVYLRWMELKPDATPKVIAYLYGGQGTINVPSWSPDGKQIAFVSNTAMK